MKSKAAIGRATRDNPILPPPLVHAPRDAVVLRTSLEKFIGRVYNTELPPMVALEDIVEARSIIYFIHLRCQPFRAIWSLHFVSTVQAILVMAAFVHSVSKNRHGAQKFLACLCGNQRAVDTFCLLRTLVIDCNCWLDEVVVRWSAALVVATIYRRHPTWQHKRSRYSSIDRVPPRHYTADMDIS